MSPLELPLGRFLNLVYTMVTANMTDDQREQLDYDLNKPTPAEAARAAAEARARRAAGAPKVAPSWWKD